MNIFGYCNLSVIPVRSEASEKSEMINQLLFGETFEIIDAFKGWKLIKGTMDDYEGFIDEKQYLPLSKNEFTEFAQLNDFFSQNIISRIEDQNGSTQMLLPGSSLRGFQNQTLSIGGSTFSCQDKMRSAPEKPDRTNLLADAKKYLNAPYLWGGRSLFGIDCSGFVQNVFKTQNCLLPRDASLQAQKGETLNLIFEAMPGDLAFFDNDEGNITHVGIIIEDSKIIHASGRVRIDSIDHHGIFNSQTKKYSHKLRTIKNIIG